MEETQPREQLSRERITTAALELVEERGFKGLTMRALGERLGVEAMAIYHYFPSKEALLEAVAGVGRDVEGAFAAFFEDMSAGGATAAEMVVALGLRYIEFAETHPEQFTLLFNTLAIEYGTWGELMSGPSTFQIPRRAVQAGIESGEFHARPGYGRDEMAYNLWALVHGLAVLRQTRLRNLEADFDTLHRALLGALVDEFRGGSS